MTKLVLITLLVAFFGCSTPDSEKLPIDPHVLAATYFGSDSLWCSSIA